MAWWVARVTLSANAWGPQALRDSSSAPRGLRRGPAGAARMRRLREVIPVALGGHDVTCAWPHLARPWQCRCCHRTAAKRSALCYARCPGSVSAGGLGGPPRQLRRVRAWEAATTCCSRATWSGAGAVAPMPAYGRTTLRSSALAARAASWCMPGSAFSLDCTPRRGCRSMPRLRLNLAGPCRSDSTGRCRQRRRLPRRRHARGGSRWVEWRRRVPRASSLLGSRPCGTGCGPGWLQLAWLLPSPSRRRRGGACGASSRLARPSLGEAERGRMHVHSCA